MSIGRHRDVPACRRLVAVPAVAAICLSVLSSPRSAVATETIPEPSPDEVAVDMPWPDEGATLPPYLMPPTAIASRGGSDRRNDFGNAGIDRMVATVGGMSFLPWEAGDGTWYLFLPAGIDTSSIRLSCWDEEGRPVMAWASRSETGAATLPAATLRMALGERLGSLGISDGGITFWLSPRFGATSSYVAAGYPVPMSRRRAEEMRQGESDSPAGTEGEKDADATPAESPVPVDRPARAGTAAPESHALPGLPDDAPQWIRLTVMQSAAVPSVILGTRASHGYVDAAKGNETAGRITVLSETGRPLYDDGLKWIRGRGNSTWAADKKPYNLRLSDAADLLGTGQPDHKWRLLADNFDPSDLRNMATLDLAAELGVDGTPDCTPVALWWNGEFCGSYLLTEQIGTWEGGVPAPDLDDETEAANARDAAAAAAYKSPVQATGRNSAGMEYRYAAGIRSPRRVAGGGDLSGLVVEYDIRYNEETCWFETPFGFFTVKEPDPASEEEVRAASELFGRAFACLFEGGGPDAHGKMASDYFDIESLARCGWLYALSEDADYLSVGSTYFYVASDGLIHAGPAWDFDLAWANHYDVDFGSLEFRPPFLRRVTDAGNPEVRRMICDEVEPQARRLVLDVLLGDASASAGGRLRSLEWYAARSRSVALMNDVRWGRSTKDRLYAIDRLRAVMGGRVAVVGDEARRTPWESRFVAPAPAAPEDVEWPPEGEEIDGTPVPFPEEEL